MSAQKRPMKIPRTFGEKVEHEMNRCRHFNGVQNDACDAGINYHELLGSETGCFAHIPCFNDEESKVVCSKLQFYSLEEATKIVTKREAHIKEFIEELNNSICSICKVQVKQRQVGRCVYGTCGHRLYQGTVMPQFAEDPTKLPCKCNCPESCEHVWDGESVELEDESGFSVTCSRCGILAIEHDMMVM
jgi:hypothetical protein